MICQETANIRQVSGASATYQPCSYAMRPCVFSTLKGPVCDNASQVLATGGGMRAAMNTGSWRRFIPRAFLFLYRALRGSGDGYQVPSLNSNCSPVWRTPTAVTQQIQRAQLGGHWTLDFLSQGRKMGHYQAVRAVQINRRHQSSSLCTKAGSLCAALSERCSLTSKASRPVCMRSPCYPFTCAAKSGFWASVCIILRM